MTKNSARATASNKKEEANSDALIEEILGIFAKAVDATKVQVAEPPPFAHSGSDTHLASLLRGMTKTIDTQNLLLVELAARDRRNSSSMWWLALVPLAVPLIGKLLDGVSPSATTKTSAVVAGPTEQRVIGEFEVKRQRLQREFELARSAARETDAAERMRQVFTKPADDHKAGSGPAA